MFFDLKSFIHKPFTFKMISIALAVLILFQVLKDLWIIYQIYQDEVPKVNSQAIVNQSNQKEPKVSYRLFGEYVPTDLDSANLQKSMLSLTVVGVIYSPNEENSQVFIESETGSGKVYRVGDRLPGGGIIKRITPYGAVIRRNGALESLSLPKDELMLLPQPDKPLVED